MATPAETTGSRRTELEAFLQGAVGSDTAGQAALLDTAVAERPGGVQDAAPQKGLASAKAPVRAAARAGWFLIEDNARRRAPIEPEFAADPEADVASLPPGRGFSARIVKFIAHYDDTDRSAERAWGEATSLAPGPR